MKRHFFVFTAHNYNNGKDYLNDIYITKTAKFSDEDLADKLLSLARDAAPEGESIDWALGDGIFKKGGVSGKIVLAGIEFKYTFSFANTKDLKNLLDDKNYN